MSPATLLQFFSTLTATLIGVLIAFRLDQIAKNRNREKTIIQHIHAIERELENNREVIEHNFKVIDHLQQKENDSSHYTLEPFSTTAWNAALQDRLVENLNEESYQNLQEVYTQINNVNELIKRLRTESLHPDLKEANEENDASIFADKWTITVTYWDKSENEVRETGLGDLIKNRSNEINMEIRSIERELKSEIEK